MRASPSLRNPAARYQRRPDRDEEMIALLRNWLNAFRSAVSAVSADTASRCGLINESGV